MMTWSESSCFQKVYDTSSSSTTQPESIFLEDDENNITVQELFDSSKDVMASITVSVLDKLRNLPHQIVPRSRSIISRLGILTLGCGYAHTYKRCLMTCSLQGNSISLFLSPFVIARIVYNGLNGNHGAV